VSQTSTNECIAAARVRSPVHEAYDYYNGRQVPLNKPAILSHTPYDQALPRGALLRLSGHKTEVGFIGTSNVATLKMMSCIAGVRLRL
jgi:hypothetical protein